jgi:oxygen-independent coproporphyrinogen-3 oxidase
VPWPKAEQEWVEEPASRLELLFLGLRTVEGVGRALYRQRFGADPGEHFGPTLKVLEAGGWLRLDSERIAPTRRGLWLADELALRLASSAAASRSPGLRE